MRTIKISKGYSTIVDDEEYERLIEMGKWFAQQQPRTIYVIRNAGKRDPIKPSTIRMHRVIMSVGVGVQVDHISGDGLDNRKSNLRLCSPAENTRNQKPGIGQTSTHKGVSWYKRARKWYSRIRVNGKLIDLGYYSLEIEAAFVYDEAAMKYFGDFARLNFAPEPNTLRVGK